MEVTSRAGEEGGSGGKVAGWRKGGNFTGQSPSVGRVIAPA